MPALYQAVEEGDIKGVKDLLDKGADANERTLVGVTSLMWAAGAGNFEIVKILVDKGADVNAVSGPDLGVSPLSYAAINGHRDIIKFLVAKGADIDKAILALKKASNEYAKKQNQIAIDYLEEYKRSIATAHAPIEIAKEPSVLKSDVDELPAIKAKPNKNSYAIVIGIEQYRQKLPKADFAAHDAQTMTEYLTKVMGYPEENIVTLLNDRALKSDMEKYFEKWLSNNVEKDGTVFIYYSGHGAPNPKTGDAFIVPYDGDPTFIAETGYSLKRLYDSLAKLQAKEIIVALDSCFSGGGGRSVIAKGARPLVMTMESLAIPQKAVVLSAASGDQTSSTYEEKGHGLFTYFMLKGIKGEGDTNGDGKIEIGELFEYIKPQIERTARKIYNNEQSPQLIMPMGKQKTILIESLK
ncbi:MAG: ankyrin repeat domain-containing protein [Nitrospirota bacterium]